MLLQTVAWHTQMMEWHAELYSDWHGRELHALSGRAPEYLFARFAWDMFPRLISFLHAGLPRRLVVRNDDGTVEKKTFDATECSTFAKDQGRGRSASPTKRQRAAIASAKFANDPTGEIAAESGEYAAQSPCRRGGSFDSIGELADESDEDAARSPRRKNSDGGSFDSGVDFIDGTPIDGNEHNTRKRGRRFSSPEVTPGMRHLIYRDERFRGRTRRRLGGAM